MAGFRGKVDGNQQQLVFQVEGLLAKPCKTTCHPQIKIQYIYIYALCLSMLGISMKYETPRKYRRENAKNL